LESCTRFLCFSLPSTAPRRRKQALTSSLPQSETSSAGFCAGYYIHKTGKYREAAAVVGILPIIGAVLLSFLRTDSSPLHKWLDIGLVGVGFNAILNASFVALMASVPYNEIAAVTGVMWLFRTTVGSFPLSPSSPSSPWSPWSPSSPSFPSLARANFPSFLSQGQVLGVASTSAILQATLEPALKSRITGKGAKKIIKHIRSDSSIISSLPHHLRTAAREAYALALHRVFLFCAVGATLAWLSVCFVRPFSTPLLFVFSTAILPLNLRPPTPSIRFPTSTSTLTPVPSPPLAPRASKLLPTPPPPSRTTKRRTRWRKGGSKPTLSLASELVALRLGGELVDRERCACFTRGTVQRRGGGGLGRVEEGHRTLSLRVDLPSCTRFVCAVVNSVSFCPFPSFLAKEERKKREKKEKGKRETGQEDEGTRIPLLTLLQGYSDSADPHSSLRHSRPTRPRRCRNLRHSASSRRPNLPNPPCRSHTISTVPRYSPPRTSLP